MSVRALVILLLPLCFSLSSHSAEFEYSDIDRVFVVGDIHGDYENYRQVLRDAGVINRRGNWIAEDAHLVQLGDIPDRGPDSLKVIQHLQKLSEQALEEGGVVHVLIGNHEVMNMLGDLRYVHPGEYEAFRSRDSRELRNRFFQHTLSQEQQQNPDFVETDEYRATFDADYPLGYVEHRIAWSAEGEIGAWVLSNNAVLKINDSLFLHGGVSPAVLGMTMAEINAQARHELNGGLGEEPGLVERPDGPLWYRGFANNPAESESTHVDDVLEAYGVNRIIVGHTPGFGTVLPKFDSRVLMVDVGLGEFYGSHRASLVIESGDLFTVQNGVRVAVPENDEGLVAYFEKILSLSDGTNALKARVKELRALQPQFEIVH